MYKYPNIDKLLSRRTFLLSLGKGALFSSIFFRLVYLQLFKSDQYKVLAEKNRISLRLIPPLRGKILDRNNNIIALNKNSYNVLIEDFENISDNFAFFKYSSLLRMRTHSEHSGFNFNLGLGIL